MTVPSREQLALASREPYAAILGLAAREARISQADVAGEIGVRRQSTVEPLRRLCRMGLLTEEREARRVAYGITPGGRAAYEVISGRPADLGGIGEWIVTVSSGAAQAARAGQLLERHGPTRLSHTAGDFDYVATFSREVGRRDLLDDLMRDLTASHFDVRAATRLDA